MKIICSIISVIFIMVFIALTFVIHNNTLTTNIETVPELNSVIYSLLIAICGFVTGFMLNQGKIEDLKHNTTKQIRKAEKANIDTKESLDKIDRLNAKIETLEVALKEALKHKEQ